MGRKMPPAVLAFVPIAGQDVATAQMDPLFGQSIEPKQADHAGNLDFEVDRPNPIVFGLFRFGTQFAHLSPRIERIGGEFAVFEMNNLGQFAAKKRKCPTNVDDMDRHVEPVEHQDAARQGAAGGGGEGGEANGQRVPRRGRCARETCASAV